MALAAATAHGMGDENLRRLKKGWVENPRRRQLVNAEVREALCRSLGGWSVEQLREYIKEAGIEGGRNKAELVHAVHAHLAPERDEGSVAKAV